MYLFYSSATSFYFQVYLHSRDNINLNFKLEQNFEFIGFSINSSYLSSQISYPLSCCQFMNLFVLTYSNTDGSHLPNIVSHHVIIVAEFTKSTNASILHLLL
jgi:hypothetical protein